MKVIVNIATRARPHLIKETVESILNNIENPETKLMVSIDDDDPETIKAVAEFPQVISSVAPRPDTIAEKWNRAMDYEADVHVPTVDTVTITTKGFDTAIIKAASLFPDGIGCVYSSMANASFPAIQGLTKKLVDKLGYIYPPYFPFWFVDHWVDDISRYIGRISFADFGWHAQRRAPKTIGLRDLAFWTSFYDAGTLHRHALAEMILDATDEPEWRKKMLISQFPLVDVRSFWINSHVRENANAIEWERGGQESKPDERYLRIKSKAESMLHRVAA